MKKITAFLLIICFTLSIASVDVFALTQQEFKQAIVGWFDGSTPFDPTTPSLGVKADGTSGLDDVYKHTSPTQRKQLQDFSANILTADQADYKTTITNDLSAGAYTALTNASFTDADARALVKGIADALTFARYDKTDNYDAATAAIKETRVVNASNWGTDAYYSSLVPLTKRFATKGPGDAFDTATNNTVNEKSLGRFTLSLRDELMKLARTNSTNVFAIFSQNSTAGFVGDIKNKLIAPAIKNIFDNDLISDNTLKVMREELINNKLLTNNGTASVYDIDINSKFIEIVKAAFDLLGTDTAATVGNIILCGVLDTYLEVYDTMGGAATSYKPNSGIYSFVGQEPISLTVGTKKYLKIKAKSNYTIQDNTTNDNLTADITSWIQLAPIDGITFGWDSGYITMEATKEISSAILKPHRTTTADAPSSATVQRADAAVGFLISEHAIKAVKSGGTPEPPYIGGGRPRPTTGPISNGEQPTPTPFIPDHIWYIRGYPDNSIKPEALITRAEVVTALYRLLRDDLKSRDQNSNSFSDVSYDAWYGKTIATLTNLGYVKGYEDGTFRPDNNITRAEMATLITRFTTADLNQTSSFTDVPTDHWAYSYIAAAEANGWISGFGNGVFRPDEHTERVQFVTIVNNVLNRKMDTADQLNGIHEFNDLAPGFWGYGAMIEASHSHDFVRRADDSESWTLVIGTGINEIYNK